MTPPATVLIVEDEIVVGFFIRALFEERGLRVAAASTAAGALQLIDSLGSSLGAAIIDVGLPDRRATSSWRRSAPCCPSCRS